MTDPERELVAALAREARGPRRNGLFAAWLFARTAEGRLQPDPVSARAHRRRVERLQQRLSSVSIPLPLRRALAGALRLVADGDPRACALALRQLTAPARETLGTPAADALAAMADRARPLYPETEQA
jgi:hypothetical protein